MCWGFAARTPLWPFPSITLWSVSELNPLSVRRVGQIIRSLNAPDVAAMGISDWSGCSPCLILEWLCSLPYTGKFVLPKARYLNRGLDWERIITNVDLPKKPSVLKQISATLAAMDDLEP